MEGEDDVAKEEEEAEAEFEPSKCNRCCRQTRQALGVLMRCNLEPSLNQTGERGTSPSERLQRATLLK